MRRRELLALIGGAAVAWPLAARAQQTALPVIGYLSVVGHTDESHDAFRRGLAETGLIASRNVAVEYRWAEGQHDRLPALAADLVSRKVNLIAAIGASTAVDPKTKYSGG
jgi:putative tryptophan/tyrosine transport system substrate-binding protein